MYQRACTLHDLALTLSYRMFLTFELRSFSHFAATTRTPVSERLQFCESEQYLSLVNLYGESTSTVHSIPSQEVMFHSYFAEQPRCSAAAQVAHLIRHRSKAVHLRARHGPIAGIRERHSRRANLRGTRRKAGGKIMGNGQLRD